jgi:hypothetical protein
MVLAEKIEELKSIIAGNDGSNAVDRRFARAVDDLVAAVFDDVAHIKHIPTRALFELFVIKVLYVGRRSRHADVIDYLGALLDSQLRSTTLYPPGPDGRPQRLYFSDVLDDARRAERFDNRFDAYRRYADNALFVTGVFAPSVRRQRHASGMLRRGRTPVVDAAYYVTTGKAMYRMAAEERQGATVRHTLERLSDCFEIYVEALNEMSERYIMGFDMDIITTKMLDAWNRYRATHDAGDLRNARRYAAILNVNPTVFNP